MPPTAPSPGTSALATQDELVEDDPRRRRLIQIGIAAAALVALVVLIVVLFSITNNSGNEEPTVDLVTVPLLENRLQADAELALTDLGLVVDVQEEMSETVDAGRVARTDPEGGAEIEVGSTVTLYVSTGADVVMVPDVRGMKQTDAIKALEAEGLSVSKVEVDHDPDISADNATKTDPAADSEVARDSEVTLYVSDGKVELPELRNLSSTEAQQLLITLGLVADAQDYETVDFDPNTVIEMSPLPGLVEQGSTVTLKIAKAPTTVAVPDVVGKTQVNGTSSLQGAGLNVTVTSASSTTVAAGKIISQNPSAGIAVALGTTVTITVSSGPPNTTPTPTPAP